MPVPFSPKALIARLNPAEKIAQLCGVAAEDLMTGRRFDAAKARTLLADGVGFVCGAASSSGELHPREVSDFYAQLQAWLGGETSHGIGAFTAEEATGGLQARGATGFPQAISQASSWDPAAHEHRCRHLGEIMRSAGINLVLGPTIDVVRDPRWGRVEETFGEDPLLSAHFAVAAARGFAGPEPRRGVAATGKHFAGYGLCAGGRNFASGPIGPLELLDRVLLPFEAAIKTAALPFVMSAYHDIDGIPCSANPWLLTGVLRERWGFRGAVVSDYFSIPMLAWYFFAAADGETEAARLAFSAGVDADVPKGSAYRVGLADLIARGKIAPAALDSAVARILALKARYGILHAKSVRSAGARSFHSRSGRNLARRLADDCLVLLKNENAILPFKPSLRTVAVIGPNADSIHALLGDYNWAPSRAAAHELPSPDTDWRGATLLEGLRNHLNPGIKLIHAPGCDLTSADESLLAAAIKAATRADVAILAVGERSAALSGEGKDRESIELPGLQTSLVRAVAATGTPIVLILFNGRPLALGDIAAHCSAIIEAWYPGEEGGNALAALLTGETGPSGRLPVSLPAKLGHCPVHYDRRPNEWNKYVEQTEANSVAFYPFGHGLTYTTFAYEDLQSPTKTPVTAGSFVVACTVRNTGSRFGVEVVQLYLRDLATTCGVLRPNRELKAFARVALKPGAAARVTFSLPLEQLAFHRPDQTLIIEPGRHEILIGASSADVRLRADLHVTGKNARELSAGRSKFFAKVTVKPIRRR